MMKFFASSIALLAITCFVSPCLSDDTIPGWALSSIDDVKKAADGGNADAQTYMGQCCFHGRRVVKDLSAAVFWFRKAAEQGDAKAQRNLGSCYGKGQGVEKDLAEAVKWIRKAAEQGDATAQCDLGICYFLGEGVTENAAEAVKWYRKAAGQEYAAGQFNLACCYTDGKGVEKDLAEAAKWYRKAAEQGVARAQYNLGMFHEYGYGVAQDYEEAVKWYRKAAEQGNARAENSLGSCYARGQGVARDLVEAYKWLSLAATQGDQTARQGLAEIERKMTPDQIAEAQRLPASLSLISPVEEPPGQNESGLELTLETFESVVEVSEDIAFAICFHNNSTNNLLLNGGALLGNGTQIWSSLEAELKSESGQRIPMTLGLGGPMSGQIYFLGVPLRAGSSYKLPVRVYDHLFGSGARLKPGKYEIRCVYRGRQSPYRDSTQMPACWEGKVQSNILRVKVLRPNLLFRLWDFLR
jgi:TPR repeat protein